MPTVSVNLDRDLHVRVKKYAEGIGVPLEKLCERAICYALGSVYPDQGKPGDQPGIDNSLPPFNGRVDNELPEGEIPVDPDYGKPAGGRPGQDLPGRNPNPNPNPDLDADADLSARGPRPDQGLPPSPETPDQELPETPEPKA